MTLKEYFEHKPKMNQAELARQLGLTRGYVNELVHGRKEPSLKICWAIEQITKGKVRFYDWVKDKEV